MRTVFRRGVILLAAAVVLPPALLAIGTFVSGLPYISTGGSFLFPTFAGPFAVLGLVGALIAGVAARYAARRMAAGLAAVGVLTTVAGAVVIARHASIASANGADVNVLAALAPRDIGKGAAPDTTVTFTRVGNHAQVPAVDPVTFYENPDPLLGRGARRMVSQYLGGSPAEHLDRARAVSSATYITPNAPPTFLQLAENDHLVPIAGALQFIDRAQQAGVRLRVVRFPWADHGTALQYHNIVNQAWLHGMLQHFTQHR